MLPSPPLGRWPTTSFRCCFPDTTIVRLTPTSWTSRMDTPAETLAPVHPVGHASRRQGACSSAVPVRMGVSSIVRARGGSVACDPCRARVEEDAPTAAPAVPRLHSDSHSTLYGLLVRPNACCTRLPEGGAPEADPGAPAGRNARLPKWRLTTVIAAGSRTASARLRALPKPSRLRTVSDGPGLSDVPPGGVRLRRDRSPRR